MLSGPRFCIQGWNLGGSNLARFLDTGFPISQGKSEKLEILWKKSGKCQGRKYFSMQFFNVNKKFVYRNVCSWIVYNNQFYISCYYLLLVLRWFIIANPFYFNLSKVVFHLDQERKLHALNCVVFFAKKFICSSNTE